MKPIIRQDRWGQIKPDPRGLLPGRSRTLVLTCANPTAQKSAPRIARYRYGLFSRRSCYIELEPSRRRLYEKSARAVLGCCSFRVQRSSFSLLLFSLKIVKTARGKGSFSLGRPKILQNRHFETASADFPRPLPSIQCQYPACCK